MENRIWSFFICYLFKNLKIILRNLWSNNYETTSEQFEIVSFKDNTLKHNPSVE